jgi:hypothetical protein
VRPARFGKTEVERFHDTIAGHHDIRGLQVAMNDALFMCGFERFGDLYRQLRCVFDRDRASR